MNEEGEYEQTTDQASISADFEVLERSSEDDWYGVNREPLGPVRRNVEAGA